MPEEVALAGGEALLGGEAVAATAPALAETAAAAGAGEAVGAGTAGMAGADIAANVGGLGAVGAAAPEITPETVGALDASNAVSSASELTPTSVSSTPAVVNVAVPEEDPLDKYFREQRESQSVGAPAPAEAPGDLSTKEQVKTGTTTEGPGGEVNLNNQSTSPAGGFKPYTGPTSADISGALKSLGVTPFQAAGLGLSAYGQYKSAQNQKSLQDQLNQQAQLTRPAAQELMSQYQSGTIGAAQEKQIADYTNQQKATIKQRYAKMGRDPNYDSAAQQEMANVDVQAASMRDTALQNVLSSGLKASGVTAGPAQQAIMAGYQQDQAAQKAQADFLAALANMQARGSGSPTTPAVPV